MTTANKQMMKETYTAPVIEVIKMENEGVIAASGSTSTEGYTPTPMSSSRGTTRNYNSASGSELEDLINDILTVEN